MVGWRWRLWSISCDWLGVLYVWWRSVKDREDLDNLLISGNHLRWKPNPKSFGTRRCDRTWESIWYWGSTEELSQSIFSTVFCPTGQWTCRGLCVWLYHYYQVRYKYLGLSDLNSIPKNKFSVRTCDALNLGYFQIKILRTYEHCEKIW